MIWDVVDIHLGVDIRTSAISKPYWYQQFPRVSRDVQGNCPPCPNEFTLGPSPQMSSDQKTLATFRHTGWWMGILAMACYNPYGSLWVVLHPLKFIYGTISFPLSNYNPTNRGFEHHQRLFAKVTFLKRHEVLLLLNLRECLATKNSGSWKTHRTEIFSGLFHGVPKNPIRKTRFLIFLADLSGQVAVFTCLEKIIVWKKCCHSWYSIIPTCFNVSDGEGSLRNKHKSMSVSYERLPATAK